MTKPIIKNSESFPDLSYPSEPLCAGRHTEALTTDQKGVYRYKIHTQTTIDSQNTAAESSEPPVFENNLSLIVENPAGTPVKVNALIANGRDFSSLPGLLKTVCGGFYTDREKALALWQFLRQYLTFGVTWSDQEFHSPDFSLIRFLNGFGSGACGSFNGALALLAAGAGIPARTGSLSDGSHAVAELFFDGHRRYFDALYPNADGLFKGAFIPDDNGEIASYEQLCADSFLTRRAGPAEIGELAALFGGNDCWRRDWTSAYTDPCDMSFTLKPGQQIVFYYDKFIGDKPPHQNLVSGKKQLTGPMCGRAFTPEDALCGDHMISGNHTTLIYRDDCPWPITGFHVRGRLFSGRLDIILSASGESRFSATRPGEFSYDFNSLCKAFSKTSHSCMLTIEAQNSDFIIDGLTLMFQVCRPSLPALRSGENTFELRADPGSKLKVTTLFRNAASAPPNPPVLVPYIYAPGRPFCWSSSESAEYEFILSGREDFAWPYAPVFHQRTMKPEFDIDPSLILRPGKPCFWRVRGKSADGVWSAWSQPDSFIWDAPPIPAGLELIREGRKLTLRWQPAGKDLTYAVYGSDEDGFTPSGTPYAVWTNRTDSPAVREICPANLICTTQNTEFELTQTNRVFCHYRIRAFSAAGAGGLPTACISLPHPFILENTLETAVRVGSQYAVYAKAVRSLGKLLFNRLPDKPMYTGFHNAQRLFFSIQGPGWLTIRDYDGYLHGTPTAADKSSDQNHFILTVTDQNNAKDVLEFEINVTEAEP